MAFDYSSLAVSDEEFNKPETKKFDYSSLAVSDEEFNKDSNFSLLEKLGAKKPKDFKPKDTSFDLHKATVSGAVGTVDSLAGLFQSLGTNSDEQTRLQDHILSKSVSFVGDQLKKVTTPALEALAVENPTLATEVASGAGSLTTTFLPGLGLSQLSQSANVAPKLAAMLGASVSTLLESGVEAGGIFNRLKEKRV